MKEDFSRQQSGFRVGCLIKGRITRGRKRIPALISVFLIILLSACGDKSPDISAYQDTPIRVTGLTEEDFDITPAELIKLDCVSESDTGSSEKSGNGRGIRTDSGHIPCAVRERTLGF